MKIAVLESTMNVVVLNEYGPHRLIGSGTSRVVPGFLLSWGFFVCFGVRVTILEEV